MRSSGADEATILDSLVAANEKPGLWHLLLAVKAFCSQGSVRCAVVLGDEEQNPLEPPTTATALQGNHQAHFPPKTQRV